MRSREQLLAWAGVSLTHAVGHGAREVSLSEYEKAARGPSPKQRRAQIAKADHNDLVVTSQRQIVLGHIHPRWLRKAVETMLDYGQDVTQADIDAMRAEGPR